MRWNKLAFGLWVLFVWQTGLAEAPPISDALKLHLKLKPPEATWKSIPWHVDLITAQHQAAKERKPIFIWSMDGHPLGCT
jgi:hypothetical protein